jgi:hypothetical protein
VEPLHKLWIPGPLPGQNEIVAAAKGFRGRGYGYAKLKRQWTQTIALIAKAARVPSMPRVFLHCLWVEPNKRRNPDNIAAGGRKVLLDGLVTAGVIRNDGWGEVAGWSDTFSVGDKPGLSVIIKAV